MGGADPWRVMHRKFFFLFEASFTAQPASAAGEWTNGAERMSAQPLDRLHLASHLLDLALRAGVPVGARTMPLLRMLTWNWLSR
jgi:hypothetical protein